MLIETLLLRLRRRSRSRLLQLTVLSNELLNLLHIVSLCGIHLVAADWLVLAFFVIFLQGTERCLDLLEGLLAATLGQGLLTASLLQLSICLLELTKELADLSGQLSHLHGIRVVHFFLGSFLLCLLNFFSFLDKLPQLELLLFFLLNFAIRVINQGLESSLVRGTVVSEDGFGHGGARLASLHALLLDLGLRPEDELIWIHEHVLAVLSVSFLRGHVVVAAVEGLDLVQFVPQVKAQLINLLHALEVPFAEDLVDVHFADVCIRAESLRYEAIIFVFLEILLKR